MDKTIQGEHMSRMPPSSDKYISENKSLVEFLWSVSRRMKEKYKMDCSIEGYLLMCEPCLRHKDKDDRLIFDIRAPEPPYYWYCLAEPSLRGDTYLSFQEEETEIIEKLRRSIRSREVESTRALIVERNYLLQGIYLSTRGGREGHTLYRYDPEKGYFRREDTGAVKHDLQLLYEKIFKEKPTVSIVPQMFAKISGAVERREEDLFSPVKGNILYLPGKSNDLEVNKETFEMKVIPKDPLNRPFLSALPYDFQDVPDEMPPEIREILTLVPPQFQNLLLYELVSPMAFLPRHMIFVNYSRTPSTGKSTLFRRMWELYGGDEGGLITMTDMSLLGERFERADYQGKGALLVDETEDIFRKGTTVAFMKKIASGGLLRAEEKYQEKKVIVNRLIMIINTNRITFPPDRTLLSRFAVIPFIHNFESRKAVPEWSLSTRQYIVNWLIRYVLPRYLRADEAEMIKYGEDKLLKWAKEKRYPPSFVRTFLRKNCYARFSGNEKHGKLLTIEEAYQVYLHMYAEQIIPVTLKEFKMAVHEIWKKEKAYLVEKNGQEMLYFAKEGLEFFMKE